MPHKKIKDRRRELDESILSLLNGWEILSLYSFSQTYSKTQEFVSGKKLDDILHETCEKNARKFLRQFRRFHFCEIRLVNSNEIEGNSAVSLLPYGSATILEPDELEKPKNRLWLDLVNPNNSYELKRSNTDSGFSNVGDLDNFVIKSFLSGKTLEWSEGIEKGRENENKKYIKNLRKIGIKSIIVAPLQSENRIFGTFSCMKLKQGRKITDKLKTGDSVVTEKDLKLVENYVDLFSAYLLRGIVKNRAKESTVIFRRLEESTKDVVSAEMSKEGFCGIIKEEVERFLACDCFIFEKVSFSIDERETLTKLGWWNLSLEDFYNLVTEKIAILGDFFALHKNFLNKANIKTDQREIYNDFIGYMQKNNFSYVLSEKLFRVFELFFKILHLKEFVETNKKQPKGTSAKYLKYWQTEIESVYKKVAKSRLNTLSFLMPMPPESFESRLYVVLDEKLEYVPYEDITGYVARKVAVSYFENSEDIANHPSGVFHNRYNNVMNSFYNLAAKYGEGKNDVIVLRIQNIRNNDFIEDNRDFIDLLAKKLTTLFTMISKIMNRPTQRGGFYL